MQSTLFVILGTILIAMGCAGLLNGYVMAGSKGLKANFYHRTENPVLFHLFVTVYIAIGVFVLGKSL